VHRDALIASPATAVSGIYRVAIERSWCVDLGAQATNDRLLVASRDDARLDESRSLWRQLLNAAADSGAQRSVLAGLDLSASSRRHGPGSQMVDAAVCLADATVRT